MLALLPSCYRTYKTKCKQSSPWRFKFFPTYARADMSGHRELPVKVRIHIRTHVGKVMGASKEVTIADMKI